MKWYSGKLVSEERESAGAETLLTAADSPSLRLSLVTTVVDLTTLEYEKKIYAQPLWWTLKMNSNSESLSGVLFGMLLKKNLTMMKKKT